MTRTKVDSSQVASIGYEADSLTLEVEYKKNGKVYQYFGVPADKHAELMAAESVGRYLNQFIKGHYKYKLVEDDPMESDLAKLRGCKSEEEWNAVCDEIKGRTGDYPEWWFREVIATGLPWQVLGDAGRIRITNIDIREDCRADAFDDPEPAPETV